ncbi:hypothetical protein CCGE525_16770 [Rhizobium jaguaris]|uniref:Uncharacterized protein n=1 Tax=Rhizobium jaguaris TaxID=1312183 RepID=A0A387FPE1_9HYPH|nr:hypothetical protein CCGE525_16770 [Rhizobium jaguaris]
MEALSVCSAGTLCNDHGSVSGGYEDDATNLDSSSDDRNVSAVSAPLDWLYFEACCVCEKVSRTIWRLAWQMMDLLAATKLSSRAAETGAGRMM